MDLLIRNLPDLSELAERSNYTRCSNDEGDSLMTVSLMAAAFGVYPKTILEYGTNLGFSACVLASVLRWWGYGKLYSVDSSDQSEARSWADKFGLTPYVEFRQSVTWEYKHEESYYDLVFLDASHDYEGWVKEWVSIQPYIDNKTLIVAHDTNESEEWKAFEHDYLKEYQLIFMPHTGLTFLRKARGEDYSVNVKEGHVRVKHA